MLKFKSDEAREAYNMIIAGGSPVKLDTYCERHHIIPKSLGGTDDEWNLVYLTAGEHLLAHYWLYVGTGDRDLGYAYFAMANTNWSKYDETPEVTDAMVEAYENAKIAHAQAARESNSGKNSPKYGVKVSDETRRKLSKALSGKNNPNYGKKASEETKKKMRESKLGEKNANYGRKFSAEIRKRMSDAQSGENHHNYGLHHSAETRKRMSDSSPKKRKVVNTLTGETWPSLTAAAKFCGLKSAAGMQRRINSANWHFEYA